MTWPELPNDLLVAAVDDVGLLLDRTSGMLSRLDPATHLVLSHREQFDDRQDVKRFIAETSNLPDAEADRWLDELDGQLEPLVRAKPTWRHSISGSAAVARQADRPFLEFETLGVGFTVYVHDRELGGALRPLLAGFRNPTSPPGHSVSIWREDEVVSLVMDGLLLYQGPSIDTLVSELLAALLVTCANAERDELLVHAAAIALDGVGVILGGASGQGKSSTTVELLTQGAHLLTDELVAVDLASRAITGMPRPIGLEGPVRHRHPELAPVPPLDPGRERWNVPPARVGLVADGATMDVLAFLDFSATAAATVRPLDPIEALGRLCALSYNPSLLTEDRLRSVATHLGAIPAVLITHQGARSAADALCDVVRTVR